MLIILIIILSLLIVGLIYTNKEHFAVKSSGVNSCGELMDGPLSKAVNTPSCFFYDINRENENIYSSLNYVSNKIGEELDTTQNINDNLIIKSKKAIDQIDTLMKGPIVTSVKKNLDGNQDGLASNNGYIDLNEMLKYYIMPNDIENKIMEELTNVINEKIGELTQYSGVNINTQVRENLTEAKLISIINEISIILYNKFEANGNIDIIKIINEVINGLNINKEIKNKIKLNIISDKQINAYLKGNSKNEISIDDMVYYRHQLVSDFPDLGKLGDEIIVGGLVCNSDDSNSTNISIRAIYFINPTQVINPDVEGPSKYKQLYVKVNPQKESELDSKCYGMPMRDLACKPNLWLESNDELAKAKKVVGNFSKGDVNEVECQNQPEVYKKLPAYVPIASVTKNLNKLLLKCQTEQLKASDNLVNNMGSKSDCDDYCINVVLDNNNRKRFLVMTRQKNIKTEFFFQNEEIYRQSDDNKPTRVPLKDDKPRYLYQNKGNTSTAMSEIFAYGQSKKWYIFGGSNTFEEINESPDQKNCCVPI